MNRTIFTIILGCVALALVAGCGGGQKEEPLHGTSTRKAQAAEPAPSAKLASFGEPMKLAPADAESRPGRSRGIDSLTVLPVCTPVSAGAIIADHS